MKLYRAKRKEDLTICTFLWGTWYGLGIEYLLRLKRGIDQHLDQPHRFVCFVGNGVDVSSVADQEIEFVPFAACYRRNLNKLFMFRPDNGLTGRVLCFDLDVIVIGDLTDIASYRGDFATCESIGEPGQCGGTLIGFQAGECLELWEELAVFQEEIEDMYRGSERKYYRGRIQSPDYWQRLYPGQVMNYRKDCRKGIPEGTRLVFFTGQPKPHQVQSGWVRDWWETSLL